MSDSRAGKLLAAAVLILGGGVALLFNFDLMRAYEPLAQYILAGGLAVGAVGFFVGYAAAHGAWWRLIPAWTLLALAGMVLVSALRPDAGRWVAALLFWGLAAAFGHIYLLERTANWWAILPGGFLAVLGLVIAMSGWATSLELLGATLFGGVGLVFFLLYLLGGPTRQWWAMIPGSVLVLFGIFILTMGADANRSVMRWWPLLAIAGGSVVFWRTLRARNEQPIEVNRAPQAARLPPATAGASAPGTSIQVLPAPDDWE